jgi:hypothetical protein
MVSARETTASPSLAHRSDLLAVGGGEHHHPHVGCLVDDLARGGHTVHPRHDEVHDHDIRPVVHAQLDGFAAVAGLGDHRDPGLLKHVAQHPARERIVIDDDDLQWFVVAVRARALGLLL